MTEPFEVRPDFSRDAQAERGLSVSVADPDRQTEECLRFSGATLPSSEPSTHGNVAAIALLFPAMRRNRPLHIDAPCCPFLLDRLEEFSRIWSFWFPELYQPVPITCAEETASFSDPNDRRAVLAYSGGVDANFSLLRHRHGLNGRLNRTITAAIIVQGCDIPLSDADTFERYTGRAASMLEPMGVPVHRVTTNIQSLEVFGGISWTHYFGTVFAAILHLFSTFAATGILASGDEYYNVKRNGSNALTDRLLSSGNFTTMSDGGEFTRTQKVELIARHPEIMRFLRFCWEGPQHDTNCGQCEKCIRTALNFRLAGVDHPSCFPSPVTDEMIRGVAVNTGIQYSEFRSILSAARERGLDGESWVRALEARLAAYRKYGPGPKDRLAAWRMKLQLGTRLRSLRSLLRSGKSPE